MTYRNAPPIMEPDRSMLVVGLNGHVYGVDRATGQLRWDNNLPGGGTSEVAIAVGYGVVIASAHGPRIYCLDYLTGQERWHADTQARGRATILIEEDHIVVAKGGYLDAYAPDGTAQWS